jgi:hypothetical protein
MSTSGRSSAKSRTRKAAGASPEVPAEGASVSRPFGLVGYERHVAAFSKVVRDGSLGHAYLFFGDAETGKHAFARSIAAFLETREWTEDGRVLVDVISISPDEKGTIGIGAARELKKFLWQTPLVSPRRTAIIDSAEALTDEAQSALLKLVEEPSPHALLLFTTYEPSVLFPPLRSRLTKVYVPRLPKRTVEEFLVNRHGISEKRAGAIAGESFGRIGRALRLAGLSEPPVSDGAELDEELRTAIFKFRASGVQKNARVLAWLVEREAFVERFNLNPNLQRKAIRLMASRYGILK